MGVVGGANFSGRALAQAYAVGDLNGNRRHNLTDFVVFRGAFEQENGAGAFARMVAGVPEPGSAALWLAAAVLGVARWRGRRVVPYRW